MIPIIFSTTKFKKCLMCNSDEDCLQILRDQTSASYFMGTRRPFPGGKAWPKHNGDNSLHLVLRSRMSTSHTSSLRKCYQDSFSFSNGAGALATYRRQFLIPRGLLLCVFINGFSILVKESNLGPSEYERAILTIHL